MARHRDEASGFVDEVAASRTMPPGQGLEHLLRSWCAYMPAIVPGGARFGDRRRRRQRLAPADGRAAAWSRIQPTTWQHLVGERGWTAAEYADRRVRSLLAELVAESGTSCL